MVGLRHCVPALVAGATLAAPFAAHAEPSRLAWSAPAPCPSESALYAEVARLLGSATFEQGGFEARATVTTSEAHGFTLVLWVRAHGSEGTRTVRAETCEPLVDVAAFSIALAANPELAQPPPSTTDQGNAEPPQPRPTAPVPSPQPPVTPKPPSPPSGDPPAAPERGPSSPAELWLGARIVGDTSLLPAPALGLGLGADVLLLGALRIGVGGQVFLPQEELLESDTGGIFTLWAIEAHACYDFSLPVSVAACPLVQFGAVHGQGRGVDARLGQKSTLVAPGALVAGRQRLSPNLAAMLGASAVFPLSGDEFVVNAGKVHEIPTFSVEALVGLELRVF